MPVIEKQAVVPFSAAQMFALVDDIASYTDFVPACSASQVISVDGQSMTAKLTFSRSKISKSFTTTNIRNEPHSIELRLVDGPFRMLEGSWEFEDLEAGKSRVSLELEFEFSSRILAKMFGPVFEGVASKLVETFKRRAYSIYGGVDAD
jgi:ribosome-associated toxin RatA of RatAB toxin-antitoxin module